MSNPANIAALTLFFVFQLRDVSSLHDCIFGAMSVIHDRDDPPNLDLVREETDLVPEEVPVVSERAAAPGALVYNEYRAHGPRRAGIP